MNLFSSDDVFNRPYAASPHSTAEEMFGNGSPSPSGAAASPYSTCYESPDLLAEVLGTSSSRVSPRRPSVDHVLASLPLDIDVLGGAMNDAGITAHTPNHKSVHTPTRYSTASSDQSIDDSHTMVTLSTSNFPYGLEENYQHMITTLDLKQLQPSKPQIKFRVQPQANGYRFRYETEGSSHGCIMGSKDKNSAPTIVIVGLGQYKSGKIRYRLQLVQVSDEDFDWAEPHPNRLTGSKVERDKELGIMQRDVDYRSIGNKEEVEISLDKVAINMVKKEKIKERMIKLLKYKLMEEEPGLEESQISINKVNKYDQKKNKINMSQLKIRVSAWILGDDKKVALTLNPVNSDIINNNHAPNSSQLKICKIDRPSGSATGNEEIWLLCEKVQKDDIKIVFRETNSHDETVWEESATFSLTDVHHQFAIVFKTPPYKDGNLKNPKEVEIVLRRKKDLDESDPIKFMYTPKDDDPHDLGKKRKKGIFNNLNKISSSSSVVGGQPRVYSIPNRQQTKVNQQAQVCNSPTSYMIPQQMLQMMPQTYQLQNQPMQLQQQSIQQPQLVFGQNIVPSTIFATPGTVFQNSPVQVFGGNSEGNLVYSSRINEHMLSPSSEAGMGQESSFSQVISSGLPIDTYSNPPSNTSGRSGTSDIGNSILDENLETDSTPMTSTHAGARYPMGQVKQEIYRAAPRHFIKRETDSSPAIPGGFCTAVEPGSLPLRVGEKDLIEKSVKNSGPNYCHVKKARKQEFEQNEQINQFGGPYTTETEVENLNSAMSNINLHSITSVGNNKTAPLQHKCNRDDNPSQKPNNSKPPQIDIAIKEYASSGDASFLLLDQQHMLSMQDENGDNGLHLAIIHDQNRSLDSLLNAMAKSNQKQLKDAINAKNHLRQTPLHLAVITEQPKVLEQLLRHDADFLNQDLDGNSIIHLAAKIKSPVGVEMLKVMIRVAKDISDRRFRRLEYLAAVANRPNYDGKMALHLAVEIGNLDALQVLETIGADPDAGDRSSGRTPLHYSVELNKPDVVKFLLYSVRASPNERAYDGITPLHLACRSRLLDMVEMLMDRGADPFVDCIHFEEEMDNGGEDSPKGFTPFDLARDDPEITNILNGHFPSVGGDLVNAFKFNSEEDLMLNLGAAGTQHVSNILNSAANSKDSNLASKWRELLKSLGVVLESAAGKTSPAKELLSVIYVRGKTIKEFRLALEESRFIIN